MSNKRGRKRKREGDEENEYEQGRKKRKYEEEEDYEEGGEEIMEDDEEGDQQIDDSDDPNIEEDEDEDDDEDEEADPYVKNVVDDEVQRESVDEEQLRNQFNGVSSPQVTSIPTGEPQSPDIVPFEERVQHEPREDGDEMEESDERLNADFSITEDDDDFEIPKRSGFMENVQLRSRQVIGVLNEWKEKAIEYIENNPEKIKLFGIIFAVVLVSLLLSYYTFSRYSTFEPINIDTSELTKIVETHETKIKELVKTLDNVAPSINIERVEKTIKDIKSRLEKLESTATDPESDSFPWDDFKQIGEQISVISSVQDTLDEIKVRVDKFSAEIDDVKAQVKEVSRPQIIVEDSDQLEDFLKDMETQFEELKTEVNKVSDLEPRIEKMEGFSDVEFLEEIKEHLNNHPSTDSTTFETEMKELERKVEVLATELGDGTSEDVKEIKVKFDSMDTDISQLRDHIDEVVTQINKKIDGISVTPDTGDDVGTDGLSMKEVKSMLDDYKNGLDITISAINTEVATLKDETEKIKLGNSETKELTEDLVTQQDKLIWSVEELKGKVEEVEDAPSPVTSSEEILETLKEFVSGEYKSELERSIQDEVKTMLIEMNLSGGGSVGGEGFDVNAFDDKIMAIVTKQIGIYDSDRINRTDYALQSMGGEIVDHSPSYEHFKGVLWRKLPFFRLGKWLKSRNIPPEVIIQPDLSLGKCFAFKGSNGYVIVRVPMPIIPDGFSIDHVAKSLTPYPNTAPKEFKVWGMFDRRHHPELLGTWTYDYSQQVQTFEYSPPKDVVDEEGKPKKARSYVMFKMEIVSNHGDEKLTCLYRFRIHGKRDQVLQLGAGEEGGKIV